MPKNLTGRVEVTKSKDFTKQEDFAKAAGHYESGRGVEEDQKDALFAAQELQDMSVELQVRENPTVMFNGMGYSEAYEYNRKKGVNYAPAKANADDEPNVSYGIVCEKFGAFTSFLLRYAYKRVVKAFDLNGKLIEELGDVLDLAVERSHRLEKLQHKVGLMFNELITQGHAIYLEDWRVMDRVKPVVTLDGKEVDPMDMDYTYEFLDNCVTKDGDKIQERRAESLKLDGRMVIFGDPNIEELQEQPNITVEYVLDRYVAEASFGSLRRWKGVPKTAQDYLNLFETSGTMFDAERIGSLDKKVVVQFRYSKPRDLFNLYINGVMMLPRGTRMSVFFPRMNYPLSIIYGERVSGSIYPLAVGTKTKFISDYADWALKRIAEKFEQGVRPALLSKNGKSITWKVMRGGQVTPGISSSDYEKADPNNAGITQSEFGFAGLVKEIIEANTLNPTMSGELKPGSTATEISIAQAEALKKMAWLLDGVTYGFVQLAERRIETIETRYTLPKKKTLVNGKEIPVFQDFSVEAFGAENHVSMTDEVISDGFNTEDRGNQLFEASFNDRKNGKKSKYWQVSPTFIRSRQYTYDVAIEPDLKVDTQMAVRAMFEEFAQLEKLYPGEINKKRTKEEYLEVSNRPADLFLPEGTAQMLKEAQQLPQAPGGAPAAPQPPAAMMNLAQ